MRSRRQDLVVVGGGTAGLVAAQIAAGAGARVTLVERERTGGDCLWTGCVPSKALIAAADLAHRMRTAATVGLEPVEPRIDFGAVMRHVHEARETIAPQDSPERLRTAGVDVIEAEATFLAPGRLRVGGRELRYRKALIATGSSPAVPPIPGLADIDVLTNETVWDLEELPRRLVVLGGGPIGCELGQAFARLGSDVTMVEMAPRLLAKEEPGAGALIAERLRRDGVDVRVGTEATEVRPGSEAAHELIVADGPAIPFDALLVAAGRRPQTEGLGLECVGVGLGEDGGVQVDERLRTSARHLYAAGDVTGALPFTHVAAYHARTAAVNALFGARRKVAYEAVPWVTFTDPEIARVGLTEAQARDRWGKRATSVTFDYAGLDRAIVTGQTSGFATLVGDDRGRLVGATVAATAGGEAIAELAARIETGAKIDAVSQAVHAYPTFAEGPARAADDHVRARLLTPRTRAVARPVLALLRAVDRPRA